MSRAKLFAVVTLLVGAAFAVGVGRFARADPPSPGQERDQFTTPHMIQPTLLCSPTGPTYCKMGIDATGPYFAFLAYVPTIGPGGTLFTYRPRGLVPNAVAQFGDGGINATELFRKLYERFARMMAGGGNIFVPGPAAFDHWNLPCPGFAVPLPTLQMVVEIESVMKAPVGGAGQPSLLIVCDNTFTFEDYEFLWDPK